MTLPPATVRLVLLCGLVAAGAAFGCDRQGVENTDTAFEGLTSKHAKHGEEDGGSDGIEFDENEVGSLFAEGLEIDEEGGSKRNQELVPEGELGELAGASEKAPGGITYPTMFFNARGLTTCDGKTHQTFASTATTLSAEKLDLNLYQAFLDYDGKGKAKEKANERIQQNLGVTSYTRPTSEERRALVKSGFEFGAYAIYAKSVTKTRQGQTYRFDPPIPVFPWPAPPSRYEELAKAGEKKWTTQVTGFRAFTATITVRVLSIEGDVVTLQWTNDIAEDQPGNPNHRALYEDFPVPRTSIYTINSKTLDVRSIRSTNWFKGDECKGRPEAVELTYRLCKKQEGDKTQDFPCQ